jgi:aminoglycoside phosphotransferase (APT) family kinase protein
VPDSLVHDDFRPPNCFPREGGYWLADWGRAWIGHPFMSLHGWRARLDDPDPSWSAYLDPFTRFASQAELEELMDITQRLLPARALFRQFDLLEHLPPGEMASVQLQKGIHSWVIDLLSK